MRLSMIVAQTRSGIIGRDGTLPWKLSDDLRRFKSLTMGHCLVMGRKTLESLGRLLPGRTTIVVSRQDPVHLSAEYAGVRVAHSIQDAIVKSAGDDELFIIGGGEIFAQALPLVSRLYVTWVEEEVAGDVRFPPFDPARWQLIQEEHVPADERNEYATTYCVYDRLISSSDSENNEDVPPLDPLAELDEELSSMAPVIPSVNVPMVSNPNPTSNPNFSAMPALEQELLQLNQKLLEAIVGGNWSAYANLCDPSITCFEPEARGELVIGMAFHKYYFDLPAPKTSALKNVTMAQPHVRVMGDAAVLSYVRLTQSLDANGAPQTSRVEETRVWHKVDGSWKHVHFHRAVPA